MKRAVLSAFIALSTATPGLANDCSRVTDRVNFCPTGSSWDGVNGEYAPRLGTTNYVADNVILMLGVMPEFARDAWDGTAEGLTVVLDSFAIDGAEMLEPAAMREGQNAATAAFVLPAGMVAEVTAYQSGNELVMVQTIEPGESLTDAQSAAHDEAVLALLEVDQ